MRIQLDEQVRTTFYQLPELSKKDEESATPYSEAPSKELSRHFRKTSRKKKNHANTDTNNPTVLVRSRSNIVNPVSQHAKLISPNRRKPMIATCIRSSRVMTLNDMRRNDMEKEVEQTPLKDFTIKRRQAFRLPPTIRDRMRHKTKKKGKKTHFNNLLLYRRQRPRHNTFKRFTYVSLREKVNMDKYAKMWLLLIFFTIIISIPLTLFEMTNFPYAPALNTWRAEEVALLMLIFLPLCFGLATIPTLIILVALRIRRKAQTTRT
jgi:hypothetical protein